MQRPTLLFLLLALFSSHVIAQGPDWSAIRNNLAPEVATGVASEYGTPSQMTQVANDGWTDGLFMSRDGLHLYCFYMPADLPLLSQYLFNPATCHPDSFPCCPDRTLYLRGPRYNWDTVPPPGTPASCFPWIHGDILYSTRASLNDPFPDWTKSNLSHPWTYDGAPHFVPSSTGGVDFFAWNTSTGGDDIFFLRDTSFNPTEPGLPANGLTGPTDSTEGNPHIEKLGTDNYLMLLDNHQVPEEVTDMWYSFTTDGGSNWTQKQGISSLNTNRADLMPHLWHDGQDWWLYFVTGDVNRPDTALSIFRAKHNTNNISSAATFDDWGAKELVISPGMDTYGSAYIIALGEPTLSQWGDISFVVGYEDASSPDSAYNRVDLDPWFLPRLGSPMTVIGGGNVEIAEVNAFPNPATESTTIRFENRGAEAYTLEIFDLSGFELFERENVREDFVEIDLETLPPGVYIYRIRTKNGISGGGRLVVQ